MPLEPGGVVLEIGCGRGAAAGLILKQFRPARIYATDVDAEMIEKATRYLPDSLRRQIFLAVADVSLLPMKSGALDAVFGFGVIHHVPDWRLALSEIARVLKPGGIYFIEELYPSLYQNFITRHILLHPVGNRFRGPDLRQALAAVNLPLKEAIEASKLGILGVAVKGR